MPKFRKKPVVIEAFHLSQEHCENRRAWPNWLIDAALMDISKPGAFYPDADTRGTYYINTLEGVHKAITNDWIIQGIKGELYPCKPDIFEATYEPVEKG